MWAKLHIFFGLGLSFFFSLEVLVQGVPSLLIGPTKKFVFDLINGPGVSTGQVFPTVDLWFYLVSVVTCTV